MKLGMDLSPRQSLHQKMILAPRMIQSMEILQLTAAGLEARIQKELQENPALELVDTRPVDNPESADGDDWTPPADAQFNPDAPLKHDTADPGADLEFQRLEALDRDWGGSFNEDEHRPSRAALDELGDKKLEAMQNLVDRPKSLQDHLIEQLGELEIDDGRRRLAEHIISFIERTGYIGRRNDRDEFVPINTLEIAASFDPPATVERVEDVLRTVQQLDPAGVGARDIRECLLLQIPDQHPDRDLLRTLIIKHLEDIGHNRLGQIQRDTHADPTAIVEAIDFIKHLNPKPGNLFSSEETRYVVPDIIIERTDDGRYEVRLTDDWVPRLRIPKGFYRLYRDRGNDPKTREYVKKKLMAAEWLRDAILQRRNTLEKVTRAIIEHQRKFLDLGPEHIEPLKMQQIADQVKVHVTTVSRAVDDKWVQTPRGVFPLKRFFVGAATNKDTGEQIPWERVKAALLEMVNTEDKNNPLSDEELEKRLQSAGFPVKRRTVTKYRKLLNIASSRERRAWTTP